MGVKPSLKSSVSSQKSTASSSQKSTDLSQKSTASSQFSNSSDDSALDAAEWPSLKSGSTGSKITYNGHNNGTTYIGEKNTMVKKNYTPVVEKNNYLEIENT